MKLNFSDFYQALMTKLTKLSYGGTAAIVTSMGLVVGLDVGQSTRPAILSSLLIIALADNLTDSLAIHIYQESENLERKKAFRATIGNFFTRFFVSTSFVILALILPMRYMVPIVLAWGVLLLGTLTALIAYHRNVSPKSEVAKHLGVALAVIIVSRLVGHFIIAHLS